MTHILNNTVHISVETNTSTDRYTEALAKSMQRTKELVEDKIRREFFTERRPKNLNSYYHGVPNGIREQTETLR